MIDLKRLPYNIFSFTLAFVVTLFFILLGSLGVTVIISFILWSVIPFEIMFSLGYIWRTYISLAALVALFWILSKENESFVDGMMKDDTEKTK